MRTLHYCALLLLLLALSLSAEARTWTAKSGETIDGEFVKLEGENVSIKLPDGRLAQIKLDLLSDADQEFVRTTGGPTPPSPFAVKFGYNTPRNVLEQETQKGNLEALYYLAQCHRMGSSGGPQDEKKADELLQRGSQSADTGNPFAQCCRAICYAHGIGVPKDEAEAVKWFRKAAEQGNAVGQARLGTCYVWGAGVPKDAAEAVKWLRLAAEQGNAEGQHRLGAIHLLGEGGFKDTEKGARYLRQSAEQGFAPAQHSFSEFYTRTGEFSEAEAIRWLHKAAEQGYLPSQSELGYRYYEGDGVRQDKAEAVKWYRKVAEQGHETGQYSLGVCYLQGEGVPKDEVEGKKWLRKAAEQGYEKAKEKLSQLEITTPEPPNSNINSGNIDPKIIGVWSYTQPAIGNQGNSYYVYRFNADGTFVQMRNWSGNAGPGTFTLSHANQIDGKFTTSGGVVYLTDLVLSYSLGSQGTKREPLNNKSSAYRIGTDNSLDIKVFSASNTIPDSEGLRKFTFSGRAQ